MSTETIERVVNGKSVNCDPRLASFKIMKMPSSNVDYYGTNHNGLQLFIQFLNGSCYIYSSVPKEVLDLMEGAESIGKAYYKFIKGKFPEENIGSFAIREEEDPEEDEEDLDFLEDGFEDGYIE